MPPRRKHEWVEVTSVDVDLPGPEEIPRQYLRSCSQTYADKHKLTLAHWSQPKRTGTGWRTTCHCNEHVNCARWYRFTGEVGERAYTLRVSSSGECGGELKKARKAPGRGDAASVQGDSSSQSCHRQASASPWPFPSPNDVRRELGETWAASRQKLRVVTRVRHKKGFASKARNKKRLSVGCFQEFVDARRSFEQSMCFMSVSLNATVLSYVVFFSAFLSVLEEWKPTKLIMQADCTFKVDWEGYVWGLLDLSLFDAYGTLAKDIYARAHACPPKRGQDLQLVWSCSGRKKDDMETCDDLFIFYSRDKHRQIWNLLEIRFLNSLRKTQSLHTTVLGLASLEDKQIWTKAFQGLAQELRRRHLPPVSKLCCDWRKEIPGAFFDSFEDGLVVQGMEHLVRALRRNRSKLGGTRKIEYVIACFYTFAYLPMHLFFSTCHGHISQQSQACLEISSLCRLCRTAVFDACWWCDLGFVALRRLQRGFWSWCSSKPAANRVMEQKVQRWLSRPFAERQGWSCDCPVASGILFAVVVSETSARWGGTV